jgi:hypothetical protein
MRLCSTGSPNNALSVAIDGLCGRAAEGGNKFPEGNNFFACFAFVKFASR